MTIEEAQKQLQKDCREIEKKVEPVKNVLGVETGMVKMPKQVWKRVFSAFKITKTIDSVVSFYEERIKKKDKIIEDLNKDISEGDRFKKVVEEYLKYENRYDDFIDYTKNRIVRRLRYKEAETRILSKPQKKEKAVGYDR